MDANIQIQAGELSLRFPSPLGSAIEATLVSVASSDVKD
jgi:hypothetical protein